MLRSYAVKGGAELVDIGANLTKLKPEELSRQLQRAREAGVGVVVLTGTSLRASEAAQRIVTAASGVSHGVQLYFTAGIHPHDAKTFDGTSVEKLRRLLGDPRCVSAGEMGLDYDRMFSTREQQLAAFRAQVALSLQVGKPLFIHERDTTKEPPRSHKDLTHILTELRVPPASVCIHCFTGSEANLRDYVARGYYIGLTGFVCMGKRGEALRAALAKGILPADRLLIETDAPYMMPDAVPKEVGLKGRNNEPCVLPTIVRKLCQVLPKEWSEVDLSRQLLENTQRFFTLQS